MSASLPCADGSTRPHSDPSNREDCWTVAFGERAVRERPLRLLGPPAAADGMRRTDVGMTEHPQGTGLGTRDSESRNSRRPTA